MKRDRRLALGGLAGVLAGAAAPLMPARAQQRKPVEPLRLGVDTVLQASGLGERLVKGVGGATGLPVQATPGDPTVLLQQIERGEFDVVLTGYPPLEELLEKKGLVHDRQRVASNDYVIVGPGGRKGDPAGVRGLKDVAEALKRIAATGAQGGCVFVSNTHSGAQLAESAMWKAAGAHPVGTWMRRPAASTTGNTITAALELARTEGAYLLVERGVHAAAGRGLEVLMQGDARLQIHYHVMRSFRVNHPGGKLLVAWMADARGRAAVAAAPGGYRAAAKG